MTLGGGPVGVPLPIGDTSAILGSSMTGLDPSLFSEAEGGWEEVGTRVTARSRPSIVAGGRRPCQNYGFMARIFVDLYCESDWDYVNDEGGRRDTACMRAV